MSVIVFPLYRAPLCHLQPWSQMVSKPPIAPNAKRELESRHFVPSPFREQTAKEIYVQGGNGFSLGPVSICQVATVSREYSNRCFVGVFMEERRILVDRAAAASCSGKFCPVPWHHRHRLFSEVHTI